MTLINYQTKAFHEEAMLFLYLIFSNIVFDSSSSFLQIILCILVIMQIFIALHSAIQLYNYKRNNQL